MAKGRGKNTGPAARNRPAKTAARKIEKEDERPVRPARPSAKEAVAKAVGKQPSASGPAPAPPPASAAKGADDAPRSEKKAAASGPRVRPAPTKRTTPPASGRYTPPIPRSEKVSPIWVPILMFACLGLGMLTIILNYVNVLPGDDPSNTYLMIGLALITIGFITATKYH